MIKGLFHEPLGVDFSASFAAGLRHRLQGQPPEAIAHVTLLVNTSRMARRVEAALVAGGATLLPRIGLVSGLAPLLPPGDAPRAEIRPLALRLRLTQLVATLLEARPDLSPPSAAFDLAGSLATLLAEMQEEEMAPAALDGLATDSLSEHWQRSLQFLRIATDWMAADGALTQAGAQALALARLIDHWSAAPPQGPVIVAGSTASRAPTRVLIDAVLGLPQGAVVLPGMDTDMPDAAWAGLLEDDDGPGQQDHPQYRHAALLSQMGQGRDTVPQWGDATPAVPARNRLLSLALRPAPATDAWREEGTDLTDLPEACAGITLLSAPSPGAEATTIALGLRAALHDGRRAALITPDRTLSRQVAAQLDRWGIVPDDSAGRPLNQSAPGRLLIQSADLRAKPVEAEPLAILLKHPLAHAGGDRVTHLRHARTIEVDLLRRQALAFPTRAGVEAWLAQERSKLDRDDWTDWLCDLLDRLPSQSQSAPLQTHVAEHLALLDRIAQGTGPDVGPLWSDAAGRAARAVVETLATSAEARGPDPIPAREYTRILQALLSAEEVRETFSPHPDVMIWGALEARVRTADLVVLGGLNDDIWPGQPTPDPWLNRSMRAACGLRLPDRSIGLSAHDFQQAASGPEIWLSRAARTAEADTVPSRWVNRITGLLSGVGGEGQAALADMRARGQSWLDLAAALDRPLTTTPAAPRPAPRLPLGTGPDRLSVTAIETLIRDPYAIYARHFLRLHALPALRQGPDARVRGSVLHDAMERFTKATPDDLPPDAAAHLRAALEGALAETTPWPGARRIWLGKFDRILDDVIAAERDRRAEGTPRFIEKRGVLTFDDPPFTLIARADRIDERPDGVAIFDYKTGTLPTQTQIDYFAKQLLLEAVMVADGAFTDIGAKPVAEVGYLSLGATYKEIGPKAFGPEAIDATRTGLRDLIRGYFDGAPYYARLAADFISYASDYDQLSRFGEWDDTVTAKVIDVGHI